MNAYREVDVGESGYGRRSVIAVSIDTVDGTYCDYCKQIVKVRVLYMDGSDGEYGAPSVCEPCVAQVFRLIEDNPAQTEA